MCLKLEHNLPYLIIGKGTKRVIASLEEVLALKLVLASVAWSLTNANRILDIMPG